MLSGRRAAYLGATVCVRVVVQSGSTLSVLLIAKFLGQEAVAIYSICLAAVWLASIVFFNGIRVMMRRHFVLHPETSPLTVYRRSQAAVFRSPRRYAVTAALLVFLALYIGATVGATGVALLILMLPLAVLLVFLGLKIEYHRAIGQVVRASVFEPGALHLAIAVLVLVAVWLGAQTLITIFSAGAVMFLAAAVLAVAHVRRQTPEEPGPEDTAAQRKILATEMLLFVFRNGFPLFFAAFIAAADLGHFRTEERLFYLLLFFYLLFETLGMKSIIGAFRGHDSAATARFYKRCVVQISAVGGAAALALFAGLSQPALADMIGYNRAGDLLLCMALAVPFYFLTYFNNLVLHLTGQHSAVIRSLLSGVLTFIVGAYLLYPWLGLDGVRVAYLGGGAVSAICSAVMVLSRLQDRRARAA